MSRFVEELKRRSVIKVALAYLVAAWVLLQVADLLVPILSLPDWTNRLVFLLLVIGFVPALIISWAYELTPEGVVRDEADTTDSGMPTPKTGLYLTAMVSVAIVAAAGWWFMGTDERWVRNEALQQIEAYIDAADWESAYQLSLRMDEIVPTNPALDELRSRFTYLATIPSEPEGATVFRRPHIEPDAPWQELGRTPLNNVSLPYGMSVIRLELDGYQPVTRVIGTEGTGFDRVPLNRRGPTHFGMVYSVDYKLDTDRSIPNGFVRINGWDQDIGGETLAFSDFFLSRYETTNEEFKVFVDAGGYSRPELWEHPIVKDGIELSWDDAATLFTDRSGRPGPSNWEAGNFAEGHENYPVSGVSWYEAAAYAKFVGRELPTVHHWRQGQSGALVPNLLKTANLNTETLAAVGESHGIGWAGNYDMLGNVREWCINAIGEDRAILGGAYNDPYYVAQESIQDPAYISPLDRSPTNGIRLAQTGDAPSIASRARAPLQIPVDEQHPNPAPDPVYEVYRGAFDYDPGPLNARLDDSSEIRFGYREVISFDAPYSGDRIRLVLMLPSNLESTAQTVVFWPGSSALFRDSSESVEDGLEFLLANGRAIALPILEGTFDRRIENVPSWDSNAGRDLQIRQIKDFRRSIDYLETRSDINRNAMAFLGFSWGGRLGGIVLAIEPRLRVGILDQAGINFEVRPEIDVTHFLPRVSQPVLQFNGRYDFDFRFDNSAKPFFELLGTPSSDKRHVVEPSGHITNRSTVMGETLDWLDKYLGPVNR